MKDGSKRFSLTNNKKERILTGFLAMFILFTSLWPIRHLDQITTLGEEKQYWGATMSLLGQNWSYYMEGEMLISYGYSLILLPICFFIKNASFAYKVAFILNGCFWVLAYLCSVRVGKKILNDTKPYVSIIGCFLIFLLPIYSKSRVLIGPDPLLIWIFWESVGLVYDIHKQINNKKFFLLGLLMIFSVWLDPTMIVIVAGTIIYLFFMTKNNDVRDIICKWILFVIAGIAVGILTDHFLLDSIFRETNIDYATGLHVLMSGILSNIIDNGLLGWIYSVADKLFVCSVNTFCLLLPALHGIILFFCQIKKKKQKKNSIGIYIAGIFLGAFLVTTLYWMQGEPTYTVDWFQLGILDVVVGPVLLFSIYYLIKSKKWIENSMIYIVSFCVITFIVAYPFKSGWVLPVNIETGILSYFCNNIESSTGIIYYAAAISIIIFLISSIFFKIKSNGVKLNTVLLMCSILVFLAGTIKINTGIVTDIVVKNQKEHREYHRIAKILNNISNDVYFIESVGSLKDSMFIMQMLANNKEIHWINNENRNEIEKIVNIKNNKDNAIFLLPTPYYNWEEMFSGYQMGYLTDNVALWFTGDNRTQKEIDQIVTDKEIKVPKVNGGKNSVYGEQIMLSPGTYTARYYIKMIKNNQKAESGRLAVVNNEEILQSKTLDNLNSGDEAKIELSFTSDKVLDNIGFQVRQGKDSKIKVQKVTYQKKNSNYTIGLNNAEEMNEVLSVIDLVDSSISQNGSIVFLDNIGDSQNNYNIRYLKKYFTNNKIDILDKVENIPDSIDYIICNNERNIYYSLLKNYTILCMNKKYILLAKDGSMQSKQMEKIQGFKWSKKNNLDIRLFLELNNDGSYDINAPIELEGGNYNYIAELTLEDNALQKDMLGIVSLTNGSHELNSVSLRASQFNNHNKCQISIPLMYMNTVRGLQMNLTLEQGVKVRAVPCYIQLRQKNYALGLEEKSIKQFANIINKSNSRAKVKFVTTKEVKEHDTVSFDYLESLMPKCEFENSIYEEVMNEKGDLFLITYGYSQKFFKMVSEYTIIANSGKYMLWTKSDGSYLVEAMKNGGVLYSQGNKISPYCIAKAQNREFDGTVEQLFTGKYRFYLNIKIDEVKKNDIVEVAMSRKKKKNEIKREMADLRERGYTDREINIRLNPLHYMHFREYDMQDFSDDTMLIPYEMACSREMENIQPVCRSWKGSKVYGIIEWIELLP